MTETSGLPVLVDSVSVQIDGTTLVRDVSLAAAPGRIVGLLGPNGSGKSTLLKAVYRTIKPTSGSIHIGHDDMWRLSPAEAARRVAVVLQDDALDLEFTVTETVALGRLPHGGMFGRRSRGDKEIIAAAMARTHVAHLSDRYIGTLSGGERQRVYLARALAQATPVLILDEPTNHLDISAQMDLLELLQQTPATVLIALHDLNLAAAFCDEVFVLVSGTVVAAGPPGKTLTPELIESVYRVGSSVYRNPLTGRHGLAFGPAQDAVDSAPAPPIIPLLSKKEV